MDTRYLVGVTIGGAIMGSSPAVAVVTRSDAQIAGWFCKVVKPGFDVKQAAKDFPLEKLSDVQETQSTPANLGGDTEVVEDVAEGDNYRVKFRYQAKLSNVSDQYGNTLTVERVPAMQIDTGVAQQWLMRFGKPEASVMGWQVGAGPRMFGNETQFMFSITNFSGTYEAHWFMIDDLKFSQALCSHSK